MRLIIAFIFFFPFMCFSQNLIPNPSFEQISAVPDRPGQIFLAPPWNNLHGNNGLDYLYTSPDLFSCYSKKDSYQSLPTRGVHIDKIFSYDSCNALHIFSYFSSIESREYINVELTDTLSTFNSYRLIFYVNTDKFEDSLHHLLISDGLQILFSKEKPIQVLDQVIPLSPQLKVDTIINTKGMWQKVEFIFEVKEKSKYMTIGNFKTNAETKIDTIYNSNYSLANSLNAFSKFMLDNFSLEKLPQRITGDSLYSICKGQTVKLGIEGDSINKWYNSRKQLIAQNVLLLDKTPDSSTHYTVIGRSDTFKIKVEVNPNPLKIYFDDTLCLENSKIIKSKYLPFFDSLVVKPSLLDYTILEEGEYEFVYTLGSCTKIDTIVIKKIDCQVLLQYPNVFTPNGDDKNEKFVPMKIKNIANGEIRVYNRWGKEIYFSDDLLAGWDGANTSVGVYFYICNFTDRFGNKDALNGWILLER